MGYKQKGIKKLLLIMSQNIYKISFHPFIYGVILFFKLIQCLLCYKSSDSLIYKGIKYLDLTSYIDKPVLVYLIFSITTLTIFFIFLNFFFTAKNNKLNNKIIQHYIIKVTLIFGFFLSFFFTYSITKCLAQSISEQDSILKTFSVISFLFYLGVVYPFSTFFLMDVSAKNQNYLSIVFRLNSITFINFYIPIGGILGGLNAQNFLIAFTVLAFFFLAVGLCKLPILTWKCNLVSRLFVSTIVWTMLSRFIELITGLQTPILVEIIMSPVFALFVEWIVQKRILQILGEQKETTLKLKVLYFLVINKTESFSELSIFLLSHCRVCSNPQCLCIKLLNHLKNLKQERQSQIKPEKKVMEAEGQGQAQGKEKQIQEIFRKEEVRLWHEFLYELQKKSMGNEEGQQWNDKNIENKSKFQHIILDQAEILHTQLHRQYESLRNLRIAQSVVSLDFFSLSFWIRWQLQFLKLQQYFNNKEKQRQSQYALNYCQFTSRLMKFRRLIFKVLSKALDFWKELVCEKPGQEQLLRILAALMKNSKELLQQEKIYREDQAYTSRQSSAYKEYFYSMTVNQIQKYYGPFRKILRKKNQNLVPSRKFIQNLDDLQKKQQKNISKSVRLFLNQQKIILCLVNIDYGNDFGRLVMANPQFCQSFDLQNLKDATINDFILPEMWSYHKSKIMNFLEADSLKLDFTYACIYHKVQKIILQAQLLVQIIPSIINGMTAAVFFLPVEQKHPLLILNNQSQLISYNELFKKRLLKNFNKQNRATASFDIPQLSKAPNIKVEISDKIYTLQKKHTIILGEDKKLFYCEVQQEWNKVPIKVQRVGQRQRCSFYSQQRKEIKRQEKQVLIQQKQINIVDNEKERRLIGEKQKIHEQLLAISQSIESLSVEKQAKIAKNWNITSTILLFFILILSVVSTFLIIQKVKNYRESYGIYSSMTNLIQKTINTTYLIRRLSSNQSFEDPFYYQMLDQVKQIENSISDFIKQGIGSWDKTYKAIAILNTGQVLQSQTIFNMILKKYVLSPLTYFLSHEKDWKFDYFTVQKNLPYKPEFTNFLELLSNCYYIIIPKLLTQIRPQIKQERQLIHQIPLPLTPVIIIIIILILGTFLITVILQNLVDKIFEQTLMLFQMFDIGHGLERAKDINQCRDHYFSDYLYLEYKKTSNVNKYQDGQGIDKNQQLDEIGFPTKDNRPQAMQQSARNLEFCKQPTKILKSNTQINQNIQANKKILIYPTSTQSQKFALFKNILPFLTLLLPSIFVLIAQQVYNKQFLNILMLKDAHSQRLQLTQLTLSYTYQIGFQYFDFKKREDSVRAQYLKVVQNCYQLQRSVQQLQIFQSSSYNSAIQFTKTLHFCDILINISKQSGKQLICSEEQMRMYSNQSKRQIFVQFLQTSRKIFNTYSKYDLSLDEKIEFSQNPTHKKMYSLIRYLSTIYEFENKKLDENYEQIVQQYQSFLRGALLSMIPFIILIKLCWSPRQMQKMQNELDQIKIMIGLISVDQISKNEGLKDALLGNQRFQSILE